MKFCHYRLWTHYTLLFWHEPLAEMNRFRKCSPWMGPTLLYTVRATLALTPSLRDSSTQTEYYKMLFPLLFFENRNSTEKHDPRVSKKIMI